MLSGGKQKDPPKGKRKKGEQVNGRKDFRGEFGKSWFHSKSGQT